METAEIITHGLYDISIILFDDHGRHARLARAGLSCDDEGGGMLLPAFLSLTDRWPDGLSEESIHLFFIKGTFLLDEFFCQLYAGNRTEDLVRHVLSLYVIGFAQHRDLLGHGEAAAFPKLDQ